MPRKKRRRRKSFFNTASVFKYLRIGALIAPGAAIAVGPGTMEDKLWAILKRYSGYNVGTGEFELSWLLKGWAPFIATTAVTYGVQKLSGMLRKL